MTYTIVDAPSIEVLTDRVNILLEKGWRPQGGVAVQYGANGHTRPDFFQAMVTDQSS